MIWLFYLVKIKIKRQVFFIVKQVRLAHWPHGFRLSEFCTYRIYTVQERDVPGGKFRRSIVIICSFRLLRSEQAQENIFIGTNNSKILFL